MGSSRGFFRFCLTKVEASKSFLLTESSLVLKIKNTRLIFIVTLNSFITLLQCSNIWQSVTVDFIIQHIESIPFKMDNCNNHAKGPAHFRYTSTILSVTFPISRKKSKKLTYSKCIFQKKTLFFQPTP